MHASSKRAWAFLATSATGILLASTSALAQAEDIVRPPKAEDPEQVSFVLIIGVAVICVAAAVGANLMPSRRTHQD